MQDNGVAVYVNGVEVGRKNMRDGAVTPTTYATSARRVAVAQNDMLTITVPRNLLVSGTNVIAAETHVNFRATPDVTFWATADTCLFTQKVCGLQSNSDCAVSCVRGPDPFVTAAAAQ